MVNPREDPMERGHLATSHSEGDLSLIPDHPVLLCAPTGIAGMIVVPAAIVALVGIVVPAAIEALAGIVVPAEIGIPLAVTILIGAGMRSRRVALLRKSHSISSARAAINQAITGGAQSSTDRAQYELSWAGNCPGIIHAASPLIN